jgi:hypothetical protein
VKHWDPDGLAASVIGVPDGCRAVPIVELVNRDGTLVEVRDRRGRHKTNEVVLVADPLHPPRSPEEELVRFATATGRRRWQTIEKRFGDRATEIALDLVRADVVHLGCSVDERGCVGAPRWWAPTPAASEKASADVDEATQARRRDRTEAERLADEIEAEVPEMAVALREATLAQTLEVLAAAATDLLEGVEHAGPRAFAQAHFSNTKAHDVRSILASAGAPPTVFERLGLRRGDRIGIGGPFLISTERGALDLAPLRGPVILRLDQPGLEISTDGDTIVVIENLQPAEIVCARYPALPVLYTAGQFGDDAAAILGGLDECGKRIVCIVDADLGGVRIARRVVEAARRAEIVDVGEWPHPTRERFRADGVAVRDLQRLAVDPLIGPFASTVLERGYPVEQELMTLEVVKQIAEVGL